MRSLSTRWIVTTSARARSSSRLPARRRADGRGPLGREVLTPGEHLHLEGSAHTRHSGAELAEPEHAQRLAVEAGPEGLLPAAVPDRPGLPGARAGPARGSAPTSAPPSGRGGLRSRRRRCRDPPPRGDRSRRCASRWSPGGGAVAGARSGSAETACAPASPRPRRSPPAGPQPRPRPPRGPGTRRRPRPPEGFPSRPSGAPLPDSRRGSRRASRLHYAAVPADRQGVVLCLHTTQVPSSAPRPSKLWCGRQRANGRPCRAWPCAYWSCRVPAGPRGSADQPIRLRSGGCFPWPPADDRLAMPATTATSLAASAPSRWRSPAGDAASRSHR